MFCFPRCQNPCLEWWSLWMLHWKAWTWRRLEAVCSIWHKNYSGNFYSLIRFLGSLCFCTDLCTDGQVWKAVWNSWRADSSDGGYHEQHHHSNDASGNTSCYLPRRKHSWALVAAYACRITAYLFSCFISKGLFFLNYYLLVGSLEWSGYAVARDGWWSRVRSLRCLKALGKKLATAVYKMNCTKSFIQMTFIKIEDAPLSLFTRLLWNTKGSLILIN